MHRKLVDILASNSARDKLADEWDRTEAAGEFVLLTAGTYVAHVHSVELFTAKTGTPGVKIRFDVADGEHAKHAIYHDCWLTPAALPQTKRDCGKLGLMTLEQLENAAVLPGRIRCKVRVALRTNDDGEKFNRVRAFEVVGIDEPPPEPFAPADEPVEVANAPATAPEPDKPADTSFDFGANAAGGAT